MDTVQYMELLEQKGGRRWIRGRRFHRPPADTRYQLLGDIEYVREFEMPLARAMELATKWAKRAGLPFGR